MLTSSFLAGNADLEAAAAGQLRIHAPAQSDAVRLVQVALQLLGYQLPQAGADGIFGDELGAAVTQYKSDRNLEPFDPVVGSKTTLALDREMRFLEGQLNELPSIPESTVIREPFLADMHSFQTGRMDIINKMRDLMGLRNKLCWRSSFILEGLSMAPLGRIAEKPIFEDFCNSRGGRTPQEFIDAIGVNYGDFLLANNPGIRPDVIADVAKKTRPDILSHRPRIEWYEIKPASASGGAKALAKFGLIIDNFASAGLPYNAGKTYQPKGKELHLAHLEGPGGERLEAYLEVWWSGAGLLFWTLCVKGDVVEYFNRFRISIGIAAIVAALIDGLLPAAEVGGVVIAIRGLAQALGAAALPLVRVVSGGQA